MYLANVCMTYSEGCHTVLQIPVYNYYVSDYLCNVLDDLGLQATETLRNIEQLLKAATDHFHDVADNMPQRLSHAISSMRHIDL